MRIDKRAYVAVTLFAAFMGSAGMPAAADSFLNAAGSTGLQLAGFSAPTELGFSLPFGESTPQLTLAKTQKQKPSDAQVCAAKCDKAYRYCYSQGRQIGKPYARGGQPCDERKLMCMRACPQ